MLSRKTFKKIKTITELDKHLHDNDFEKRKPGVYLSMVVPVSERYDNLREFVLLCLKELNALERSFEFIFVIDDGFGGALKDLKELKEEYPEIKIIKLNRKFGEATTLSVGFEKASGEYVITLPPYFQVEPEAIRQVLKKLEEGNNVVITRRYPRVDSIINRIQTYAFHWIVKRFTGVSYRDMGCGLRGMHRKVVEEISLYGDLHRFIPILAHMQGFKIVEIEVQQSLKDSHIRLYKPGVYIRRFLDILTIFFLYKFTKKPLRFFGLIGILFFMVGFFINSYLAVERLLGQSGLANRPLLLLGVLAMVLGIQIASIGLLGEIIIFTHARETKDYQIEEILE